MATTGNYPPLALRPCDYKVGKFLGEGSYAKVKEAYHIGTGKFYAVKIINKQLMEGREHMVLNEINILKKVSQGHPNLLQLVDYFESINNLYLVTELCQGGELYRRVAEKGFYHESQGIRIIRAIVDAVSYLHAQGIVHRDLKSENILFKTPEEDSDIMIADFGLSRCLESEKYPLLTTLCGTPGFMSPELLQGKAYGKPVDMWAIGVIVYFILSGYAPFDRDSTAEEIEAIMEADFAFTPTVFWDTVSENAKDFIRKLLEPDVDKRMTAEHVLKHPFLLQASYAEGEIKSTLAHRSDLEAHRKRMLVKKLQRVHNVIRAFSFTGRLKDSKFSVPIPLPVDENVIELPNSG